MASASGGLGASTMLWILFFVFGGLGLWAILNPSTVIDAGWLSPFRMIGFITRLFSEGTQPLVARIFGGIYLFGALIIGFLLILVSRVETKQEFLEGVLKEFQTQDSQYDMTIFSNYDVVLTCENIKPNDEFEINIRNKKDDSPTNVARYLITEANKHFGVQETAANQPASSLQDLLSGATPAPANAAPPPPAAPTPVEDLPMAERMLHDAAQKWKDKDYDAALKCAEKAVEIRTRILGDEHVKTIEAKTQLTQARQAFTTLQISSPKN